MPSGNVSFCGAVFALGAETVDIVNECPSDLESLRALTKLRELRITQTNPHRTSVCLPLTLEPLADLHALEVIALPELPIEGLVPLAGLSALREVDVSGDPIDDLTPLQGKVALQVLRARA